MTDKLKTVLLLLADFDKSELDEISACFRPKSLTKNSVLLHEGGICKEFYFIYSGCVRTFFMDKNGHEKTRYVLLENHLGTALTSFISQKPSTEFLEALEATELLAINHVDFYRLADEMNHWKAFNQRILEMAYSFQVRRMEQLVTLTAKQRYDSVQKENPKLIQRLSNRVLASYLDIREETLSRLKSN